MKPLRSVAGLALVFVGSSVFAAPEAPKPTSVRAIPTGARAALSVVKVSAADAERVKAHSFKPANVLRAIPEDQTDGPSLVATRRPVLKPGPATPKLNVAKFGETVHNAFKENVRGYALGLRKNGQPILTLIWDSARTPNQGGKAWTLDTRMHVASVSKLMTAIIATKLLDERGLSFDTKIGSYLPTYWNEGTNASDITFRELLTHRAAFTVYDGDYASFKRQIEMGVSSNAANGIGYTNGTFSLVRVLTATMTGGVSRNATFEPPVAMSAANTAAFNDAMWDVKTTDAFLAYAQAKVFTPSGVAGVSAAPSAGGAFAYAGKADTQGWDSGDLRGELGGAGFRLSVNDVLDVMGTFRRKGTIVSAAKAKEAIEATLGIDQAIDTPAGKIYNKNGAWRTGKSVTDDIEQSVAYFFPEDIECVVLVNSWLGTQQASLRGTIRDAYVANLD